MIKYYDYEDLCNKYKFKCEQDRDDIIKKIKGIDEYTNFLYRVFPELWGGYTIKLYDKSSKIEVRSIFFASHALSKKFK